MIPINTTEKRFNLADNVFSLGTKVFGVFYYLASPLGYTRLRSVPCESFIMSVCYIFSIAQNALSLSHK